MKKIVSLGLMLSSLLAVAETTTVETQQGILSNLSATIDIRPTYLGSKDAFVTENSYSFDYSLSKDTSLGWLHYFNTNLSGGNGTEGGMNLSSYDAFLRAKFKNLWVSESGAWDFAIQPRVYLPFDAAKRDNGYVGTLRTYFDIRRKFSPSFAVVGSFIPLIHAYSEASTLDNKANKAFELRYYVTAVAALADKLSLIFPVKLEQARYRDAGAGVADSNGWGYKLYLAPEMYYAVDDNLSVGVGFESASFVGKDFSGFDVANAMESGKLQVILQASI